MRRTTVLAGAALALGGSLVVSSPGVAAPNSREYVVLYEQGASADAAAKAIKAAGGTIVTQNTEVGVATVRSSDDAFAKDAAASKAVKAAVANRSIGRAEASRKAKETSVLHGAATDAPAEVPAAPTDGGDPLSSAQWDMRAIGATPNGSYATQRGSHAVRVGILDTGVDGNHPDIRDNFNRRLSRNFTTDDPTIDGPCAEDPDGSCADPVDVDENEHGTHVASTIGSPLNGLGMAGVAPGVELVNIRAGQDSGYFFLQPTVDALTYAGDTGIDVVNMSYYIDPWLYNCGANPADSPEEQLQQRTIVEAAQRALDYARARGVTLISAEGNGNTDLGKPAFDDTSPDYPADAARERTIDNSCLSMPTEGNGVIGVTSVGPTGRKAYYSDYGLEQADVAAPGGDAREYFGSEAYRAPENQILAAYPTALTRTATFDDDRNPETPEIPRVNARGVSVDPTLIKSCANGECGWYQDIQGTSMASPHAAGVAALIVAARGVPDPVHGGLTLSPDTVEQVLLGTATDTPCPTPALYHYPFDRTGFYDATCEGTPERNGFFGEGVVNAEAASAPAPTPPGTGGNPGTGGGGTPGGGTPGNGGGTQVVVPKLTAAFAVGATTRVKRLALTAAPGATVKVACTGGGCPRGTAKYTVTATGKRNLLPRFAGRRLQPGARITVTVTTPGIKDRRFVLRVRSGASPLSSRAIR